MSEDTFDFPITSHRFIDEGKTPPVVRAFRTECRLVCIHPPHEESFGGEWICSHMLCGVRLWSFATSVEQGRAFAIALEALVGFDRLAMWRVNTTTNYSNLDATDFANLASAIQIAQEQVK